MYYLQSRYYDAKICRFINADGLLVSRLLGYNLFAYCENNPVIRRDPTGMFFFGDSISIEDDFALEGAGEGGSGASSNLMGAGTMYHTARIRGNSATYDVCGYAGFPNFSSSGVNTSIYKGASTKNISVTDSMAKSSSIHGVCFVTGTMVKAAEGDVPIESIQVGDYVYAHNPETGETELKPVVQTFVNEATELVHVFVAGEEIICTNEHPFYSPVKGWIEACKLRAGDILVSLNGEYIIIEQVQHEILEAPIKVYNFEVMDFHTYFVGDGDGVLVHNTCGTNSILPKNGTKMNSSDALDLADDFLGKGYSEMSPGRFVSYDGLRQVRLTPSDLSTINNHAGAPILTLKRLRRIL